jgi:hypothetical protein
MPAIRPMIPSPLRHGHYRTKFTPHFQPPKKLQKDGPPLGEEERPSWLRIGFNQVTSML